MVLVAVSSEVFCEVGVEGEAALLAECVRVVRILVDGYYDDRPAAVKSFRYGGDRIVFSCSRSSQVCILGCSVCQLSNISKVCPSVVIIYGVGDNDVVGRDVPAQPSTFRQFGLPEL